MHVYIIHSSLRSENPLHSITPQMFNYTSSSVRTLPSIPKGQRGCVRVVSDKVSPAQAELFTQKDNTIDLYLNPFLAKVACNIPIIQHKLGHSTSTQLETYFSPENIREVGVENSQPENSLISLLNLPGFNARGTMPLTCISGP